MTSSILWTVAIGIFSTWNDVFFKWFFQCGELSHISPGSLSATILFLQFFTAAMVISLGIIAIPSYRKQVNPFKVDHVIRSIITTVGFLTYRYSLSWFSLSVLEMQIYGFCIPVVTTIFSMFFLKEKAHWLNYLLAVAGMGIVLNIAPVRCQWLPIAFVIAFAAAEVYIKYMNNKKEYSNLDMMFSFYFYTTLLSGISAVFTVGNLAETMNICKFLLTHGKFLKLLLGLLAGDIGIQISLFYAFSSSTSMAVLLPFRFSALLVAFLADRIFFQQSFFPMASIVAIAMINIGSFFVQHYQSLSSTNSLKR